MHEAEPEPDLQRKTVGEHMSEARQALGLELEDIAERTRIPLRHLQAIENSDFSALPATTYSAGFVKTYARLLGLDGEAVSADFRAERGESSNARADYMPFEPADPSRVPPRLLAIIALGAAILFGIAYAIWRGGSGLEADRQLAAGTAPEAVVTAPAALPAPAVAPQATLPPAPSPSDVVTLTATDTVWLKVYEKEGPTLFMGQLEAGHSYTVPINAKDPRLLTGRPQSLRATAGAREIGVLGSGKRSISDVSLKGPALIARAEANPVPAEIAAPLPVSAPTETPRPDDAPSSDVQDEQGNLAIPPRL